MSYRRRRSSRLVGTATGPTRPIDNAADLGRALLHAAVETAMREQPTLGHEPLSEVVLPQVQAEHQDHLNISLYAAFKAGLFSGVQPQALSELSPPLLAEAIVAGRNLSVAMDRVLSSSNPSAVNFRVEEARVISAWVKLTEGRVPARNHLVAYAHLGKAIQTI